MVAAAFYKDNCSANLIREETVGRQIQWGRAEVTLQRLPGAPGAVPVRVVGICLDWCGKTQPVGSGYSLLQRAKGFCPPCLLAREAAEQGPGRALCGPSRNSRCRCW